MSVTSVGFDQSVVATGGRTAIRQARQDFDQLYESLQSGNLSAAQQAYSDFQQIQAGLTSTPATQTASVAATTSANPVAADWSALGQALQSGSLTSAQDALGKLQQDAQAVWQAHLQRETQNAQSVYALMQGAQTGGATSAAAVSTNPLATVGSVQNDLSALNQALQTGDTAAAQKLLAQLEQDLQATNQASGQNYGGHHHHHHHGSSNVNAASATAVATPSTSSVATAPASVPATGSAGTTSGSGSGATA